MDPSFTSPAATFEEALVGGLRRQFAESTAATSLPLYVFRPIDQLVAGKSDLTADGEVFVAERR
jgi:hypothetical protein